MARELAAKGIRSRIRPWLVFFHLIFVGYPLAALPTQGDDVYVLRVAVKSVSGPDNNSVSVQLAWKEDGAASIGTLEWRDPSGMVLQSQAIFSPMSPSGAPSFEADLGGVLDLVPQHGWSYWVGIRGETLGGADLTPPFPVHVVGCAGSWGIIPGLATDAIVLSRGLSSALDQHTSTLDKLAASRPDLGCEISTVEAQLGKLEAFNPPSEPLCFWQMQILGHSLDSKMQAFDLAGDRFQGIESGATHCYSSRSEGGIPSFAWKARAGITPCDIKGLPAAKVKLKIKTRCREVNGDFIGTDCSGSMAHHTEISALAKARLNAPDDGVSEVCSSELVDFRVGGELLGRVRASASHQGQTESPEGVEDQPMAAFQSTSESPAVLEIKSTGGASADNSQGIQSFAEYGNWFSVDTSAASSCTVFPESLVHFESAPFLPVRQGYLTFSLLRNQGGGIKEPDW